jgi:hypothetical protein
MGRAALVVEAAVDLRGLATQLCDDALAALGEDSDDGGDAALRARLLAQRGHLALYDGDLPRTAALSRAALDLARGCGDDGALAEALHARLQACPGPAGVAERLELAAEMRALARRTDDARMAMWGQIWCIGALVQGGRLMDAALELAPLRVAVGRVGGPVGAWHLDRVIACVAQARGRFGDAVEAGRRAFDQMRGIEPTPAAGRYFALQCALARHIGLTEDGAAFAQQPFDHPPPFVTMTRLHHAFLLLCAGRADAAGAAYQQAGPPTTWVLPPFFVLPGYAYGSTSPTCWGGWSRIGVGMWRAATAWSTSARSTWRSGAAPPRGASRTGRLSCSGRPWNRPIGRPRRESPPRRATTWR